MLNFTGQSRRRNVNLGNRAATTKQDLLLKAKQERDRRAQERQRDAAARIIQSSARKYLACRYVLNFWSSSQTNKQVVHLIPAFGDRLYEYVSRQYFSEILLHSQSSLAAYPGTLGNVQLLKILSMYKDDSLVIDTLNGLNLNYPTPRVLVNGVVSFLKNTVSLSYTTSSRICDVMKAWKLNGSEDLISLFELNSDDFFSPSILLDFYKVIGSFDIFPKPSSDSSILLENLSYIYSHVKNVAAVELCIASCFKNMVCFPSNSKFQHYVEKLYEKPFIDKLANMVEQRTYSDVNMDTIANFINCSVSDISRDSILITLLSRPSFFKKLYFDVENSNFDFNEYQPSASFSIFIKLLEMYLLISTDHELLSESSGFTVENLVEFTSRLKRFVFNNLWSLTGDTRPKIVEDTLPLLQKIYLRDSRLHFCSTKKHPDYWSSKDAEFLNVSLFRYIEDYERLYREYADTKEDMYRDDDNQISVDEMSSIKLRILNQLSSTFKNTVSTRQFKKLEILIKAPFFIPFQQRVDLFYMFIALDKERLHLDENSTMMNMFMPWNQSGMGRQSATISREKILVDACNAFNSIGERFKAKLAVTFVNEFGPEAGIDGGGITKEFLTSVSEEGFNSEQHELFQTNDQHELYPSTNVNSQKLRYLWFLGKILGKCLYDHVLIDVNFADFFLKKILNYSSRFTSSFDDLCSLDSALYSNLVKLLSMTAGEIDSLDLSFEITSGNPTASVVELIPNGSHIKVKKENVLLYIIKIADFKLNRSLFKQVYNFHGGMSMIIAPHWMEMFNSVELQMLISGGGKDIDLKDLKENTEYGGYLETDETIRHFWQILAEFKPEERLNFIKFVTSVPRAPLQGFGSLEPKFGIRNAGREVDRLPTASTCVNLIKLPDYQNKSLLRQKLLYSINSGARFDLS